MIKNFKIYRQFFIAILIMSLFVSNISAQNITVKAKLDTNQFLIGDQVGLELEVKQPVGEYVGIPNFDQQLSKQLEVVDQSKNDTGLFESGYYLIKKRLLITSFDSGVYALAPIPFIHYSDTLKTDTLFFQVHTVAVDTSKAIKDIKMPYSAPLSLTEVLPWVGGGLGLILIVLIIIYVIRKIRRNEPILRRIRPREPAHIIALRDLSKLKDEKLWQKDQIKEYYTALTDILRMYLWNRYAIRTLERTSDEILESLKISDFKDGEAFEILKEIFHTSDLVKFAKFKPLADEHLKSMDESYSFIDRTKLIVEENVETDQVEEVIDEEKVNKDEVKAIEENKNKAIEENKM